MVTLKDIAAVCGVSVSTVSRALNGVELISPGRAERIRAAAREMGYTPDASARALKTNRSWMIGVLYEERMTHPYFSLVIDAVRASAEKRGFDVLLLSRSNQNGRIDYSDSAVCRRMDGVVIVYAHVDDGKVNRLLSGDIPVVSVDDCDRDCDVVFSDYRQGTRQLMEAAIEKGHRRIAFVHGEMGYATRERIAGFREALAAHGLAVPETYLRPAAFNDAQRCAQETEALLRLPQPPTCILMPDDFSALNALQILRARGLQSPRDFSCIGYDGIGWAQALTPRLTTYRQNTAAAGEAIFEQLVAALNEGLAHEKKRIRISGTLIPGETLEDISGKE